MRILILRHGQTALNAKGYFNGQYDEPLNATGRAEAAAARPYLDSEQIDAVYCSPLSRTRETCEIAIGGRGLPVTFDNRLMERTMGTLDGSDLSMRGFEYGRMFDLDYAPDLPGHFETWPDVFARTGEFLEELIAKYLPTEAAILLVTHAGTARAIYYHFFPAPADGNILEPKMHNCEIAEYQITALPSGSYDATYRLVRKKGTT